MVDEIHAGLWRKGFGKFFLACGFIEKNQQQYRYKKKAELPMICNKLPNLFHGIPTKIFELENYPQNACLRQDKSWYHGGLI